MDVLIALDDIGQELKNGLTTYWPLMVAPSIWLLYFLLRGLLSKVGHRTNTYFRRATRRKYTYDQYRKDLFGGVPLEDILLRCGGKVPNNTSAWTNYHVDFKLSGGIREHFEKAYPGDVAEINNRLWIGVTNPLKSMPFFYWLKAKPTDTGLDHTPKLPPGTKVVQAVDHSTGRKSGEQLVKNPGGVYGDPANWPELKVESIARFKVDQWVRTLCPTTMTGEGELGFVHGYSLPLNLYYVKFHGVGPALKVGAESLEPAYPKKGEWWHYPGGGCGLDNTPRHRGFITEPFQVREPMNCWDSALKCGCLQPLNFGRGSDEN